MTAQPIGQMIALDKITLHPDLQARCHVNEERVKEYTAYFREGREMDPIHVFTSVTVECPNYLSDGNHRFIAAMNAESKKIPTIVHEIEGDEAEVLRAALYFGIEKNAGHGLSYTTEDKYRAVWLALKADRKQSDKAIARLCRVSSSLVAKVREKGVSEREPKKPRQKKNPETRQTHEPVESTAPEPGSVAEAAVAGDANEERVRTMRDWKRRGEIDVPEVREIFSTKTQVLELVPRDPAFLTVVFAGDDGEVIETAKVPILSFSTKGGELSVTAERKAWDLNISKGL